MNKNKKFELSIAQWHALAAMKILRSPVSLDLLSILTQLLPSQLFDLINYCLKLKCLVKNELERYMLTPDVPAFIEKKLPLFCTDDLALTFLERLLKSELSEEVSLGVQADLHFWAGQVEEAAAIENELGYQALDKKELGRALGHFEQTLEWISDPGENIKRELLFTSAVFELSHLRFCSGEKLGEIPALLNIAKRGAKRRGDIRTRVLLELHMVRHICHENRLEEAISVIRKALDDAKVLGDDFLSESAEFSGLYYFYQGLHKEALTFFEEAIQRVELKQNRPVAFYLPHWLGLCAIYTGQFHRAIGVLDCNWRRAQRRSEWALADNFRGDLGIVLLIAGKTEEAYAHLTAMLDSAMEKRNQVAIYWGQMGLAYYHYLENRPRESHTLMQKAVCNAAKHNILFRQYSWPWFLEILYGFNRLNYEPIQEFSYPEELEKKAKGLNILLRGVALRLKAKEAIFRHDNYDEIETLFESSEQCLKKSKNPIELGKTWVELARYKLRKKEFESAWNFSLMAWEALTGFNPALFPPDLRPALERSLDKPIFFQSPRDNLDRIMDSLDKLVLSHNVESFLQRVLSIIGNFFGAGRGGVFWCEESKKENLRFKVGYNLSEEETSSKFFLKSFAAIVDTFKTKSPLLKRNASESSKSGQPEILAMLCIPLEIGGHIKGVFYYDNSYDNKSFDILSKDELGVLSQYMGRLIGCITTYFGSMMESSIEKIIQTSTVNYSSADEWKGESQVIKNLLSLADKAADSDASILILGETGVGKELLAQRIHRMNKKRCNGPFHVIDVSNISESLIESELFGYEKGAFTGADRRKLGRLELSHEGTLFIDEIGNIPLQTQSKLLRALQERSFVRVGGTKTIHTDFRLLAATNQDLKKDIELGRFRADLFYRINVVPINIPPLRDRGDDVLLLADYFLETFSKKHEKLKRHLSEKSKESLLQYHWPGNIRELKNVIERAVLLDSDDLPGIDFSTNTHKETADNPFQDLPTMDEMQQRYISYVLDKTSGRISGKGAAAEILGMKRTTLSARIKKLGI